MRPRGGQAGRPRRRRRPPRQRRRASSSWRPSPRNPSSSASAPVEVARRCRRRGGRARGASSPIPTGSPACSSPRRGASPRCWRGSGARSSAGSRCSRSRAPDADAAIAAPCRPRPSERQAQAALAKVAGRLGARARSLRRPGDRREGAAERAERPGPGAGRGRGGAGRARAGRAEARAARPRARRRSSQRVLVRAPIDGQGPRGERRAGRVPDGHRRAAHDDRRPDARCGSRRTCRSPRSG